MDPVTEHITPERLAELETTDPVLLEVGNRVIGILSNSNDHLLQIEFSLVFVDFKKGTSQLRRSKYYTPIMMSLLKEKLIIVNAAFLLELEAAIRSLHISPSILDSPYCRSDAHLFGFIKDYASDPAASSSRLRRNEDLALFKSENDPNALEELTLATLFFILHEIGHLSEQDNMRNFGMLLDEEHPLEERHEYAVVKMCAHVDEFKRFGFGLPVLSTVHDVNSPVRQKAGSMKMGIVKDATNNTLWMEKENQADTFAIAAIKEYLLKEEEAERKRFSLISGLFAAGFYFWHKDLHNFMDKIGLKPPLDNITLTIGMLQNRDNYIHAASLFGDMHRFILLRSVLVIKEVLSEITGSRDFTYQLSHDKIPFTREDWKEWRLTENLVQDLLLRVVMDTAVKLAYFGCATGFINEKAPKGQLHLLNFESINTAVDRIKKLDFK